ncbi:hypothetical protein GOP47_0026972, partial [Adiantum capillus-veneris]
IYDKQVAMNLGFGGARRTDPAACGVQGVGRPELDLRQGGNSTAGLVEQTSVVACPRVAGFPSGGGHCSPSHDHLLHLYPLPDFKAWWRAPLLALGRNDV